MKKSKRIVSLAMASSMLMSATSAFAMPGNVVVIGDKAYDMEALFNEDLTQEIKDALSDSEEQYYNLENKTGDDFKNLFTNETLDEEISKEMKNIELSDGDGNRVTIENFKDEKGIAKVTTAEEFKAQVNNKYAGEVKLEGDIELGEDALEINQLVDLDLNGHKLKGDLSVSSEAEGNMIVKSDKDSTLDGNLSVDAPNGGFVLLENINSTKEITLKSGDFINKGKIAKISIDSKEKVSIQNDGEMKELQLDSAKEAVLKGSQKITKVKIEQDTKVDLAVDVADLVADEAFELIRRTGVQINKLEGVHKSHIDAKDQHGNVINTGSLVTPDYIPTPMPNPNPVVTAKIVTTSEDFKAAMQDSNITKITVAADLKGDVELVRESAKDITVDFKNYQSLGHVTITAPNTEKITLNDAGVEGAGAKIANLTIDAPKAHVENNVEITGDVNIKAVAASTFEVKDAAPSIKMQGPGKLDVKLVEGVTAKAPEVSVETNADIELAGTIGTVDIDANKAPKAQVQVTATEIGAITGSGEGQNINLDTEAEVEVKGTVGEVSLEKPAKVKVNAHVTKIDVKTKAEGVTIEANEDIPEIVTSADIEISGTKKVENVEISKDSAEDIKITANAHIGKIKTDKSIQIGGDKKIDEIQAESKKGQAKIDIKVDKDSKQEVKVVNTGDGEVKAEKGDEDIAIMTLVDSVSEKIENLPSVELLTLSDESAVSEAIEAMNALTDEQRRLVKLELKSKLKEVSNKMAELKLAAETDEEKAGKVAELIESLPSVELLTLSDESAVSEAIEAMNALTDEQRRLVKLELKSKLKEVSNKMAELKLAAETDEEKAGKVAELIESLPSVELLTLSDESAVSEAIEAMNALTDEQRRLVKLELKSKLKEVSNKMAELKLAAETDEEKAGKVAELIESLPSVELLTLSDESAVSEAIEAMNALTDEQRRLVKLELKSKLKEVSNKMAELKLAAETDEEKAGKVAELIESLPSVELLTLSDESAVSEAIEAMNALTDEQRRLVKLELKSKLKEVSNKMAELKLAAETDEEKAGKVAELIESLPSVELLTLSDESAVSEAIEAMNALTDEQRRLVKLELKSKLKEVSNKMAELKLAAETDEEKAGKVAELIESLPSVELLTLSDESAVSEAIEAMNALTDEQRRLVKLELKSKLKEVSNKMAELKMAIGYFEILFDQELSSATSVTFAADSTKAVKLTATDLAKEVTLAVYGDDKQVTEFVYKDAAGWTDGSNNNLDPANGLVVNFDESVSSVKVAGNLASLNSIGLDTDSDSVTAEVYAVEGNKSYNYDNGEWKDSAAVKEKAEKPSGLKGVAPTTQDGKGKITGTTTAMEYASATNDTKWMQCTDKETIVDPCKYLVRVAKTYEKLASDAVEVVVGEYQVTDAGKVEAAKEALNLDVKEVTENIDLPETQDEATITWESSNTDVISNNGVVARQDKDTVVTLTATLKVGEATATKEFTVTVKAKEQEIVLPTALAVKFAQDMQSVSVENANIVSVTLENDLKENVSFTVYESETSATEFVYTSAGWTSGGETYDDKDGSNLTVTFSDMHVTKIAESNGTEIGAGSLELKVTDIKENVTKHVYTESGNTTTNVYGAKGWEKTTN